MNILKLIKQRKAIRKYTDKPIPKKLIDEIIEAGKWGPSVPSFLNIQPWRFVVITNKDIINKIAQVTLMKSKKLGAGANILLSSASRIINGSHAVILIYNSGEFRSIEEKYKAIYANFKELIPPAELSAISAAIQNMVLIAESLGIGSCWLDTPLFSKEEINKILNINKRLIAVLTLGYPAEKGRRAPRKSASEMLTYIT
jgi:nitroreductase